MKRLALYTVVGWELAWWARRLALRKKVFACAVDRARFLGRPLVVIGAPDRGPTAGYPCGDITVDLGPSQCPRTIQVDISAGIPLQSDSSVVFVSCTLEYVPDLKAALGEIQRIAGSMDNVFIIRVEPWTLTA